MIESIERCACYVCIGALWLCVYTPVIPQRGSTAHGLGLLSRGIACASALIFIYCKLAEKL